MLFYRGIKPKYRIITAYNTSNKCLNPDDRSYLCGCAKLKRLGTDKRQLHYSQYISDGLNSLLNYTFFVICKNLNKSVRIE